MVEFIEISMCEPEVINSGNGLPLEIFPRHLFSLWEFWIFEWKHEAWFRKKTKVSLLMDLKTKYWVLLKNSLPAHLEKANQR